MSQNETIRTSANVRIMLSYLYCNFEIATTLENANGVSIEDIEIARKDCQKLATDAVNEFKAYRADMPEDVKTISYDKIADIKQMVEVKKQEKAAEPEIIEAIKKMPEYKPKNK